MGYALLLTIFFIACYLYRKYFHDITNFSHEQAMLPKMSPPVLLPVTSGDFRLNVSSLLLPVTKRTANLEFKPNPERKWVIDLTQRNGNVFFKKDLKKLFDQDWQQQFPATIYGLSVADHRWTRVFVTRSPDQYTHIQVAIDVQRVRDTSTGNYNAAGLEAYLTALQNKSRLYRDEIVIDYKEPIPTAIAKAKFLLSLQHEFYVETMIVLQRQQGFDRQQVAAILLSTGLRYSDDHSFHWINESAEGHEFHFSVRMSSPTRDFVPVIEKNSMLVPNEIIFAFLIPRSADPINTYLQMHACAEYCQAKLGGILLNSQRKLLNPFAEKNTIDDLVSKMNQRGIKPGSAKALAIF